MTFTEAVRSCLSQYVGFSGRARRSEYWYFQLFHFVASFVAVIGALILGGLLSAVLPSGADGLALGLALLLAFAVLLGLVPPTAAVLCRRLHDTGHSGWWWLISIIPFGGIVILIFTCTDSQPDNQYGPSPKGLSGYPGGPYGGVPYGGPAGYGQPQPGYGQNPPAYGQNPPAYGQNPPAYGQNPPAYGQNPPAYGQQPGYGQTPPGYGQPPATDDQPPGYGQPQ